MRGVPEYWYAEAWEGGRRAELGTNRRHHVGVAGGGKEGICGNFSGGKRTERIGDIRECC